ncbi:hypothetical protein ACQPW1_29510 [Nocardia sp. CA-128927]|uniref:hypothetical protein n=1 Tax=Nocardia sp. CA-128927 TaxID=3239975 RepID=UPI003D996B61
MRDNVFNRTSGRLIIACAAMVPMFVAAALAPAGAHAGYEAAERGGACAFAFNREPYLLHNAVVVGGVVECSPAPFQFYIELQLWHRSGTSNPRPKGDAAVSMQIPAPRLNVAAMALDCVPGVWQGRIVMRATWDTGTDEARKETLPTFIQC